MKNNILIKGGGFSSLILYELLKRNGNNVDLEIGNNVFVNTFISLGFFEQISFLFKKDSFIEYKGYYYVNGKLKYGGKLFLLGEDFFNKYNNLSNNLDKLYDYEFKGDKKDNISKNNYEFGKLKVFKIIIKDFMKNFTLEFYDNDGIPSYFYHIGGNNYIFGFYTFSSIDTEYLYSKILKIDFFSSYSNINIEYINEGNVYDINYTLIYKNEFNDFYIGNNIGVLPPFLGIGNKLVFVDSLFILDFINKGYNSKKLFDNLYNYRKIFFDNSKIIGKYIKNNGNTNYKEIEVLTDKLNRDLDKIINFFIK